LNNWLNNAYNIILGTDFLADKAVLNFIEKTIHLKSCEEIVFPIISAKFPSYIIELTQNAPVYTPGYKYAQTEANFMQNKIKTWLSKSIVRNARQRFGQKFGSPLLLASKKDYLGRPNTVYR